ncbi:hypothetical protein GCM10023226_07370 [Nocardioides nanhaiensis]|uniref:Uncharacterized protein n=1 Tax=Nocardioides nanhaiensis TaxID=1476871 RepID=A0ABP8VUE5_9ACTN
MNDIGFNARCFRFNAEHALAVFRRHVYKADASSPTCFREKVVGAVGFEDYMSVFWRCICPVFDGGLYATSVRLNDVECHRGALRHVPILVEARPSCVISSISIARTWSQATLYLAQRRAQLLKAGH